MRSRSGIEVPYDRLLIATGSKPIMLPIPGVICRAWSRSAIWPTSMRCWTPARRYRKAVVIGGGLLGLEAANALVQRGMDVTVVHLFDDA